MTNIAHMPPIKPTATICPRIYAWSTTDIPRYQGWLKIGYTASQSVDARVAQQGSQLNIDKTIVWQRDACKVDSRGRSQDEWFTDHDFHRFLETQGVVREQGSEWFDFSDTDDPRAVSEGLFDRFVRDDYSAPATGCMPYTLRSEQEQAVSLALDYFASHERDKFLWNAKPRFGKTLAAYDLMQRMPHREAAPMTLIVTNRPAIAGSWHADYSRFIAGVEPNLRFVSTAETLKGESHVLTREEFIKNWRNDHNLGMIAFLSLQDLKGAKLAGGGYEKLEWVYKIPWDLLIIDEAHEGVDTKKSDRVFGQIDRSATLYLSGTPFKALAKGDFADDQMYSWSYLDEQQAKQRWPQEHDDESASPYEDLPRLAMYTYQMSQAILGEARAGMSVDKRRSVDYAFDLNEFFSTKPDGSFVHDEDVDKFLDHLSHNASYPFSPKYRDYLAHTLWLVGNRVASAKAMQRKLKAHSVFGDYEIVLAAGDGDDGADGERDTQDSINRVRKAIAEHAKTITLSVGQLTTGVTVPQWSAVLMLSNTASNSLYIQAAFRAQNPWVYTDAEGVRHRKETAYVFDFAPERSLKAYDEFANDLLGTDADSKDREQNIGELINFFPVIGADENGVMRELDPATILIMPSANVAREIVRSGFMSNLLFANIGRVFGTLGSEVQDILNKFEPGDTFTGRKSKVDDVDASGIEVDEQGEVVVNKQESEAIEDDVFGDKIYATDKSVDDIAQTMSNVDDIDKVASLADKIANRVTTSVVAPNLRDIADEAEVKLTARDKTAISRKSQEQAQESIRVKGEQQMLERRRLSSEFAERIDAAPDDAQRALLTEQKEREFEELKAQQKRELTEYIDTQVVSDVRQIAVEETQRVGANADKNKQEDAARERLRGFARTIPSFIMAYGDGNLTLANFDAKVDADVFLEVTSITLDEFRTLRDAELFNEPVFNQSIAEFLHKKEELADWFVQDATETIFDYIPAQRNNQIYTPPDVVVQMADSLEEENPGIYSDPNETFADLYAKSGLFCAEIIKRLYAGLADAISDERERLRHIVEHQVYGIAPSEIIYRIMITFLFSSTKMSGLNQGHFIQADTMAAIEQGDLDKMIEDRLGLKAD